MWSCTVSNLQCSVNSQDNEEKALNESVSKLLAYTLVYVKVRQSRVEVMISDICETSKLYVLPSGLVMSSRGPASSAGPECFQVCQQSAVWPTRDMSTFVSIKDSQRCNTCYVMV